MSSEIIFKDNTGAWIKTTTEKLDDSVGFMATSIKNLATILAPIGTFPEDKSPGKLKASGRVNKLNEAEYEVTFGGGNVPYARLRHYVNNRNPQTKLYLERAGEQITKKGIKPYL